MCAIQDAGLSTSPSQNQTSNPNRSKPSHGGKNAYMSRQQGNSAQKPQQSREQKRKNWAKRSKPVAKPSVRVAPAKVYTSACCQAPATKPKAGQKEVAKDAETGKMKSGSKGLGHWRCGACGKACKVTVGKPEAKETFGANLIAAADSVIAEVAQ